MDNENQKEIDKITGVETTGHEWDGLKELNNPAPRWWLWVFFITIIWSVGYWIMYPAWPTLTGNSKGALEWTQYEKLANEQAEISQRQATYIERFHQKSFQKIMSEPDLYNFAMAGGKAAFKENCAMCHGSGGEGKKGYPNLNDDDWLWGGKLDEIYYTIKYGVRSDDEDARISQMPAFGKDGLLNFDEINAVVDYTLTLSGGVHKKSYDQGQKIFKQNCAACHGEEGRGDKTVGAPNLSDAIWLYGEDRKSVYDTVFLARKGVMPAWDNRLDDDTLRALTIFLHELGGGEPSETIAEPVDVYGPHQ